MAAFVEPVPLFYGAQLNPSTTELNTGPAYTKATPKEKADPEKEDVGVVTTPVDDEKSGNGMDSVEAIDDDEEDHALLGTDDPFVRNSSFSVAYSLSPQPSTPYLRLQPEDPDAIPEPQQLTVRAVFVGCCLGGVIAASNVYLGLKTGWTFGASLFGSIFGVSMHAPYFPVLILIALTNEVCHPQAPLPHPP